MTAEELAKIVDEQGRTRRWIAMKMGVSDATVSLWLSGGRTLPDARAAELAALLGMGKRAAHGR